MDIAVNKMTYNIKNNKFMVNNKMVDIAGLQRYHENLKNVLNTKETAGAADAALAAAKEYADGLVDGKFDEVGAADAALESAKAYADGLAVNYDDAGAATQALADAKTYVDDKVNDKFDAIGAAATAEQNAKAYADGLAVNYDATGSADAALAAAKADAAEKYQAKGNYEAAGAATQALVDAKSYVDGLAVNYDAAGAAATAEQNAKSYADGLAVNYDAAGTAATAEQNAKSYADGLVDGKFDEVGAADAALAAAKADAAEKYQVKGDYEEAGAAAQALEAAKEYVDGLVDPVVADVEVLKSIDHDKLAADAAAAAVATVLDGAPEAFDTLKEVADWIANNETASDAAALVTRVTALEAIDHEAYKTADEGVLADAKAYADGLAVNYDKKGDAAQALVDAKAYADGLAVNYDAAGTAETKATAALEAAKTYVDGKGYLVADDLQFATDAEVDALFA